MRRTAPRVGGRGGIRLWSHAPPSSVIPGHAEGVSPESIISVPGYGFRARPCGPSRNDDLRGHTLISLLNRSISAPRCGLSFAQSMWCTLVRSAPDLAIAFVIAPSNLTLALVGIAS